MYLTVSTYFFAVWCDMVVLIKKLYLSPYFIFLLLFLPLFADKNNKLFLNSSFFKNNLQLSSFEARTEYNIFSELRQKKSQSSGFLQMKRPSYFRWESLVPIKQIHLLDGKKIWKWTIDAKNVQCFKKESVQGSFLELLKNFQSVELHYRISPISQKEASLWLEKKQISNVFIRDFIPKNNFTYFTFENEKESFLLGFDNKTSYIAQIILPQKNKNVLEIKLSEYKIKNFQNNFFELSVPKDATLSGCE